MKRLLILFLLFCPALVSAGDVSVEGRVFTELGPLEGAKMYAYKNYADIRSGIPFVISNPSDEKGLYKARLPEGEYYFTAKGNKDGKEYFAFHGKNPIKLKKKKIWVTFIANENNPPPVYSEGVPSIEGVASYKGQPVKEAYVALYSPDAKPFRGLGLKTESVGEDGRFSLAVSPGKYVVIVKKMESGKGNKPLKKGDLFCYYPYNPVEIKVDKTVSIVVPCYPKDDRSVFVEAPFIKTDDYATLEQAALNSNAGIRGRITDIEGNPVPGITVLAYKTESPVFQMFLLSHGTENTAESDKNGGYFIPLNKNGDYTLVARDVLGSGPRKGEIFGLYQGNHRHVVFYKTGDLADNINITVGKVMEELTEGQFDNDMGKGTKDDAVAMVGPITMENQVISTDTVWQGNILINGVVSVKRGATLTIRPGTVIKFSRIDQDHNGIGDGEILIEGRLMAQGTKDKGIVFTSAEENPQINDWSYVQFLSAENDNIIEYCKFQWAYAGVMVHYSNVRITDNIFTNNYKGLHFNTANLFVDHNTFKNNKIGIRFMRFEGNISISNNTIQHNDTGVLFVKQHVNAVDFRKLDEGGEPPRFFNNNICANSMYNISLGYGQDQDINISNNWWCETESERIVRTIYDNEMDSELSRVIFSPFLTTMVYGAGVRE